GEPSCSSYGAETAFHKIGRVYGRIRFRHTEVREIDSIEISLLVYRVYICMYIKFTPPSPHLYFPSLVNFFVNLGPTHPEVKLLQSDLLNYRDHLYSLRLSDSDIANYDDRSLSPTTATIQLLQQTVRSLIDVPLFLPGLIAHLPIYVLGKIAAHYEIYEEVRAQNKIFAGLLFVPLTYVALFFYIWYAWFATSLFGLAFSAFTVVILAWYHTSLIDDRYENWKDLVGRWRLFDAVVLGRGMWGRKKRVEETKRAREKCLRSVRTTVKKFKNQEADIMVVWEALKKRVATGEERKMERKGLEWVRDN
ncbi:hypothetical protein BC938DRAFT_473222, partial [Jimgerdemannia flammicorona]